jgi:hypothetical protein
MTTVINGNLTVNGTVSAYLDTSLNSLPENAISYISLPATNIYGWYGGVLAPNGKIPLLKRTIETVCKQAGPVLSERFHGL